uniref:Reverse transcriptase domain-containing protein n=1 Tax=Kryptolebias marmoratus TaxID=37003 RepID=A0A3Q3A000_KRYMA
MPSSDAPSAPGDSLRFVSWNVKGLNSPIKRKKVFNHLKHLNPKIAFLQETHLKLSDQLRLRCGWVGQVHHSSFNSKARGVAILIHKSVPFSVTKVISDPNGRYIIVLGRISSSNLTLVNLYGPNWDDEDFFKNILFSLPDLSNSQLILGGDFNCCLDPLLDRSSNKSYSVSKSSKVLHTFMQQYAVSDVWRYFNPNTRKFSFFSPVHSTFSRIDFFLLDNKLLSSVRSCCYNPIVISDHSPVILDLSLPGRTASRPPWRFNSVLLNDSVFVKTMNDRLDLYVSTNITSDVSAATVWETCKAYLRGEIIAYSAYLRKTTTQKSLILSSAMSDLQAKCAESPAPDLIKSLLIKKAEFDTLASDAAVALLLKSRYSYYEFGDKPSKILAHQIRQRASNQHIVEINISNGTSINPQTINNQFRDFYSTLYTSECSPDQAQYESFFDSFTIPTIDPEAASDLDKPFTLAEVKSAILSMQSGKCSGPDGFPSEFFKVFSDKLSPLLLNMLKEACELGVLPLTMRQATISLILKGDKDPRVCNNYRPISLLCTDVKILAKMLAKRLEIIMTKIINPDQTGFIKNRHSFHNIRRLLNIMYSPASADSPEVIISMDAEKAFDRVEWSYLFYTLRRFGFGCSFISWIKLLYTSPLASVRTNNDHSEYFHLGRGTRQGCPLSPLLFAIAIEPLAAALRSSPMQGITRGGLDHKVSLYADDLLLFLSDPETSMPLVLDMLEKFGQISGYKLNFNKSELFPINDAAMAYPLTSLPFKISLQTFKYLGIHVTKNYSQLFKVNSTPLLDQLTQDLQRWSMLPLSLAGRISCIKMNVLPKFLYLFQCLPVFVPKKFFRSLDASVFQFIWNRKPPRIRKSILQKSKEMGGLATPNFLCYYWSVNIRTMLFWRNTNCETPKWLPIEEASCSSASLLSLLCLPPATSPTTYTNNIIVKNCLRIWAQIMQHFRIQRIPLLSPLNSNPLFPPSLIDKTFSVWKSHGLFSVKDLYLGDTFASFAQLSSNFNLPAVHFFRFLQVRDFIRHRFPGFPITPAPNMVDQLLEISPIPKGTIPKIYNLLMSNVTPGLGHLQATWSDDLNTEIDNEMWQTILERIHTSSICARHRIIQCKVVHRVHWSKSKLARIFPDVDSNCGKCGLGPATLGHMFWTCPSLFQFRKSVFDSLSVITSTTVQPSPLTALFGVLPKNQLLPLHQADLVAFLTLLARRIILMHWKNPLPPSHSHWIKDALSFMKLEKIRHTLKGSEIKFLIIWSPFLDHVRSLTLDVTL